MFNNVGSPGGEDQVEQMRRQMETLQAETEGAFRKVEPKKEKPPKPLLHKIKRQTEKLVPKIAAGVANTATGVAGGAYKIAAGALGGAYNAVADKVRPLIEDDDDDDVFAETQQKLAERGEKLGRLEEGTSKREREAQGFFENAKKLAEKHK